jgi:hypothetical protein
MRWLPSGRIDITTNEHREHVSLMREARTAYRAMAAFDRSIELDPEPRELVKIRASQMNGWKAPG